MNQPAQVLKRPFSLRLRMSLIASMVLVIALGLVGYAIDLANQKSAVSALQARMESYVYLVLAAAEVNANGRLLLAEELTDPRLNSPGSGVYISIRGDDSEWRSPSALGIALPESDWVAAGQTGFRQPVRDEDFFRYQFGVAWQLENEDIVPFTVNVLVDPAELQRQVLAFRQGLFGTLGLAGVFLLLSQVFVIVLGFRPLRKVTHDVAQVESGRTETLDGPYPKELEPLARNVNRLLRTEKANQQRYRSALDSLAHSLKTPLAVLKNGLESSTFKVAESAPGDRTGTELPDPEPQRDLHASMNRAVDDMHQLITTRLQRAAASTRRTMAPPVAVEGVVQRVLNSLAKVYSHKMIQTEVKLSEGLVFYGEERDLLELLGNLLDNAYKYGHQRVRISGSFSDEILQTSPHAPGFLHLEIEDDGPGVSKELWPRLLQRGIRGDERAEGHGLGLAIVVELVAAYGGELDISEGEWGGACIQLDLPAYQSA